jgi:dihydroorotate dehydrogenase
MSPGATLVELYTALAYDGPALVPRIKRELAECLRRDGFKSVQEAVGTGVEQRPAPPRQWYW